MALVLTGISAIFATVAFLIAGVQLAELAPLIAEASGLDKTAPLRGIFRIPAYIIMLATALPLLLGVIGIIGLRRF